MGGANKKPAKSDFTENQKDGIKKYMKKWESVRYQLKPTPHFVPGVFGYSDVERKRAISHLKSIASIQGDIMSMLKTIEDSSRKNTNCSAKALKEQQTAIAEMETSLDDIDEPELPELSLR